MSELEQLAARLQAGEGFLLYTPVNRRYLTGFPSSLGYLLITGKGFWLLVDGRYYEAACKAVRPPVQVVQIMKLSEQLGELVRANEITTLYTETELTLRELAHLQALLPAVRVEGREELTAALEAFRAVKRPDEVDCIRRAQRIAEEALEEILHYIKPGVREADIALELDYRMRKKGAEDLAFETIAVAGANASLPHGVPGDYAVRPGDFIVMDFGAVCGGYRSDMTRTVAVGYVTDQMRQVYDTVLAAQRAALDNLRAGLTCADGDKAARSVIEAAGYGACFNHSTGHGVGLEIHEAPNLSARSRERLCAGQIVTVEPGVYLPGKLGVRIENMVLITEEGCENLTLAPKELIIL